MNIIVSNEYDNFEKPIWGREIKEATVKELVESMGKHGYLPGFPMVCSLINGNGKRKVWEGNHRLEAARRTGIAFMFVEDPDFTPEKTLLTNVTQNPWRIADFANYYSVNGNIEYTRLIRFHSNHPKISLTQCAWMLGTFPGKTGKQSWRHAFDHGRFVFTYEKEGEILYPMLADFAQYIDFAYSVKFINVIFRLLMHPQYKHKKMMNKMTYLSRRVVRCPTVVEYLKMFSDIYNYKVMEKNHVFFEIPMK